MRDLGFWQVLAVCLGASAGALTRWQAGLRLGAAGGVMGGMALGTLAVNCAGGFLIGLALAWFRLHPEQELWRLLGVVGFLGGLTTFSAFSGESLNFLLTGRYAAALMHTLAHVLGALALAAAGHALGRQLWG